MIFWFLYSQNILLMLLILYFLEPAVTEIWSNLTLKSWGLPHSRVFTGRAFRMYQHGIRVAHKNRRFFIYVGLFVSCPLDSVRHIPYLEIRQLLNSLKSMKSPHQQLPLQMTLVWCPSCHKEFFFFFSANKNKNYKNYYSKFYFSYTIQSFICLFQTIIILKLRAKRFVTNMNYFLTSWLLIYTVKKSLEICWQKHTEWAINKKREMAVVQTIIIRVDLAKEIWQYAKTGARTAGNIYLPFSVCCESGASYQSARRRLLPEIPFYLRTRTIRGRFYVMRAGI